MSIFDFFKRKINSLSNKDRIPVQTSQGSTQYVEYDTLKEEILSDVSIPEAFQNNADNNTSYATGWPLTPFKSILPLGNFSQKYVFADTATHNILFTSFSYWLIPNFLTTESFTVTLAASNAPLSDSSRKITIFNYRDAAITINFVQALWYVKGVSQGSSLTIPANTTYEFVCDDFLWSGNYSLNFTGKYLNNLQSEAAAAFANNAGDNLQVATGWPATPFKSVYSFSQFTVTSTFPDTNNLLTINTVYSSCWLIPRTNTWNVYNVRILPVNLPAGNTTTSRIITISNTKDNSISITFTTSTIQVMGQSIGAMLVIPANTTVELLSEDIPSGGNYPLIFIARKSNRLSEPLPTILNPLTTPLLNLPTFLEVDIDFRTCSGINVLASNPATRIDFGFVFSQISSSNDAVDFVIINNKTSTLQVNLLNDSNFRRYGVNSVSLVTIPATTTLVLKLRVNNDINSITADIVGVLSNNI